MTQDKLFLSKLVEDQQQIEKNIDLSSSRSYILRPKLNHKITYHQNKRAVWLIIVTLISVVLVYPVIHPLLHAAFSSGNLIALTFLGCFIAVILWIFIVEKLNEE